MAILVTGSAGHLGDAIIRSLKDAGRSVFGMDITPSPNTHIIGSITQRQQVRAAMQGITAVIHTATLHKPHVATHERQDFVDTNITGTLNLLEEAVAANIKSFVFTSTTSVFGNALVPPPDEPAAWITEDVAPSPKNIYGITKLAGENLCELFTRKFALPTVVLRTSRFFPEQDDSAAMRNSYVDDNTKANEFLFRRVDIHDAASAHLACLKRSDEPRFDRYIISATTPFTSDDLVELRKNAPDVLARRIPAYQKEYEHRGWTMFPSIDRVYVNDKARAELDWRPRYDFAHILQRLAESKPVLSELAHSIGSKGYHSQSFVDGPYPVD